MDGFPETLNFNQYVSQTQPVHMYNYTKYDI